MSTTRITVAVVGLGYGVEHIRAYRQLSEQFELAMLCDIDPARLEACSAEHEVGRTTTHYDEVLASDVDVIDICTPPYLHFEMVRAALRARKHVVCEKPLVSSLAEVDSLIVEADRAGRKILPIFQYRFGNGLRRLKALVERGIAGRLYLATVETTWRRDAAYYANGWRGQLAKELGGVLPTHALHSHDMLTHIAGPIKSVAAFTTTRVNPVEVEDCAAIAVEFQSGAMGTLSCTLGSTSERSRLLFCFENVRAESGPGPYTHSRDRWSFIASDPRIQAEIDAEIEKVEPEAELYEGQFHAFHRALRAASEMPATLAEARASVELLTACYWSRRTGEIVSMPIGNDHAAYSGWLNVGGS